MFRNIKIGVKILFVVLFVSLFTLSIISVISYTQMLNLTKYSQDANIQLGITASLESKNALLNQTKEYMKNIVNEQAESSNAALRQINAELSALTNFVEQLYAHPEQFTGKAVPYVPDAPEDIVSPKYMFAPGVKESAALRQELRLLSNAEYAFSGVYKNNNMLDTLYIGTESGIMYRYSKYNSFNPKYDPRVRDWYTTALQNPGKIVWIDTYIDPYGTVTVSCARAFKNKQGVYTGVVGTDITLTSIIERILALRIGMRGYAFLLDENCEYIAHPHYGEPSFDTNPLKSAEGSWRDALIDMLNNKYGTWIIETRDEEYYLFSALLAETNWKLCVRIPLKEIVEPAEKTKANIDAYTIEAQGYIRETLAGVIMRFIIIFAVSAIFVVAFSYIMSLTITRPIEELSRNVRKIGGGDLDIKVPVNGSDEVAELGNAFNKMTDNLKGYIVNISKAAAEKERINSELSIAAEIQNDMLPSVFPKFSGSAYFSIFSKMVPAKEVGGDFYDFFYVDKEETKLALVIADVSGKGVPASLFMVIAKTLIKQRMLETNDPAGTLAAVNKLLCEDNRRCMFVTVLICSINLVTGEMIYANAGHNPPLLSAPDGGYQFMELKKGLPPGVMDTSIYQQCSMNLNPGNKLYLYTDGINEAMNAENKEWGRDRFLETANKHFDLEPEAFDGAIRAAIAEYVSGAEQSDDITTIAFTYKS
ncbi:MAG: SpoIIE family protein phosphatase [Spirochaetaceae bacterium]|jgi:sigma-B regulation protein RsbU (phosphoserine phosphatase)|nr:SpoIIE family protein phosphatase [Spirochaetaceae bacterium]